MDPRPQRYYRNGTGVREPFTKNYFCCVHDYRRLYHTNNDPIFERTHWSTVGVLLECPTHDNI